ncbi:EamA family transporter [Candidatus Woesearchaeota archaeon]|nr:EamA family transporter [Candidatus Woesearchaeota archaeon]
MLWAAYAFAAAVFHAMGSIIGKKVLQHEHALEYGASQGVYLLLLVFALPFIDLAYDWRVFIALYVISVILTAGNLYYLRSVRHSELSSCMPLMNISPLFLLVIAFVLLGEMPDALAILGVFLLVMGTYFLQMGTAGKHKGLWAPFKTLARSRYALYMIFAMLIFSFTATMQKAVVNWGIDVITIVVLVRLFMAVNYVGFETAKHGFGEIVGDLKRDGLQIFGSTFTSFMSDIALLLAMGVPGALVSLIIPVKRLSTFFTSLIGGRLFHEHRLGLKLMACCVMLVGVVLVVV